METKKQIRDNLVISRWAVDDLREWIGILRAIRRSNQREYERRLAVLDEQILITQRELRKNSQGAADKPVYSRRLRLS